MMENLSPKEENIIKNRNLFRPKKEQKKLKGLKR